MVLRERGARQNALPARGLAVTKIASIDEHANCRLIYLGFVGALERSDSKDSGVVQIRNELRGKECLMQGSLVQMTCNILPE
jgi:hypothetical protein